MATGASIPPTGWNPWPHRLAVVTTVCTFVLILAGGIVTTTGTGMAVPDWPTTFGYNMFLYPWEKMVGGILYEHTHRLIGSLVGALTLTLAVVIWGVEPRPWMRMLGVLALVAVTAQGVLGGLRVVLAQDGLAIVHGGFAHAFLALIAGVAVMTARGWHMPIVPRAAPEAFRVRRLAALCTIGLYAQVILGTLVTHLGIRVDAHLVVAGAISVGVIMLGSRIVRCRADWPELVRPAETLRLLWLVQLPIGAGAYVARFHAADVPLGSALGLALPVAHRLVAGAMLIAGVTITVRLFRRIGWSSAAPRAQYDSGKVPA